MKKIDILAILTIIYAAVSICMNIFSVKPLSFGFSFIVMDAGLLISWIPYLISGIITESFGKDIAKRIAIITTVVIFLLSVLAYIESYIPTLPEYSEQANHFRYVFNSGPRIIVASTLAFIVGSIINIDITASKKTDRTFALFVKMFLAGLVGQFVDNIIFETVAFAPFGISLFEMRWMDVFTATIWSTVVEVAFESICIIPIGKSLIKYVNELK